MSISRRNFLSEILGKRSLKKLVDLPTEKLDRILDLVEGAPRTAEQAGLELGQRKGRADLRWLEESRRAEAQRNVQWDDPFAQPGNDGDRPACDPDGPDVDGPGRIEDDASGSEPPGRTE